MGSPKKERLKLIKYLNNRNIKITVFGGGRNSNISVKEYANYNKKSKISMSFSQNSSCHVINARTFETLACNSMPLEEGVETPKFFIPFDDYVPYYSRRDCEEKN